MANPFDRNPSRAAAAVGIAVLVASVLGGCSGSSEGAATTMSDPARTTSTTASTSITSTGPGRRSSAAVARETAADGNFRQGIARSGDGWIFTNNLAIYRTDDAFTKVQAVEGAIPADLAAQGYDHLGDPDVHDGLLWIPVEKGDKDAGTQVTARYDEDTLAFVDSVEVPQHHNSFVTVDDDGTAYSTDEFSDDAVVRYRIVDGEVEALDPLALSHPIDRIQGGDVADGALWLSTDDDVNGVYRVDLETGEVHDLGSMGRVAGEGEGIDATDLDTGLLHALVADEAIVPMWVVDLRVSSAG